MKKVRLLDNLINLSKYQKTIIIVGADLTSIFIFLLIFREFYEQLNNVLLSNNFIENFLLSFFSMFLFFNISGFYKGSIRVFESYSYYIRCIFGSFAFSTIFISLYPEDILNRNSTFIFSAIIILSLGVFSILHLVRSFANRLLRDQKKIDAKNILIYGAGEAGKQLFRTIESRNELNIVGFFDDSNNLKNTEIFGKKVFGRMKDIPKLKKQYSDFEIYLAIPSASAFTRNEIITKLEKFKIAIKTVPGYFNILEDEQKLATIQDLSIDDLLPRRGYSKGFLDFRNRNVLITGAGGSIGSEITRQILAGKPNLILLYEISEFNLYSIEKEINSIAESLNSSTKILGLLGDVKDFSRLSSLIKKHKITNLYHAAAYKHVPIVEHKENIVEGVKNNVFGTYNVLKAAVENNVKKMVIISTDKAVRPTNVMGASKRVAEMIAQAMSNKFSSTVISMVRFGNVMNSSGSVLPLFQEQIKNGGPVTLTHKEVTRFFMTISEASSLVLQSGEFSKGGEVFLLNMGEQVKIYDIAEKIIHLAGRNVSYEGDNKSGIQIKEIGLRPGEKLYEELLISGKEEPTPNPLIFKSKENFLNYDEMVHVISKLEDACKQNNIEKVLETFEKVVEGYKP